MRGNLFIAPVHPEPLTVAGAGRKYAGLLCSAGYETRSRAAAEHLHGSVEVVCAAEFERGHTPAYEKNKEFFDSIGAERLRFTDREFLAWVPSWLERFSERPAHLAVDVSSMSRPRIAGVVQALAALPAQTCLVIDFVYVPAQYSDPPELPDATEALAPVTRAFAGEPADPEKPMRLIVGLGYEPERVASAVDELAPESTWPLFPLGADPQFEDAVSKANQTVLDLEEVEAPIYYEVNDPFRCFSELEAFVGELTADGQRPLLLPLGPKVFSLVCMLVAITAPRVVPVWRVSSGAFEQPADRQPQDELVTLRVSNQPIPVGGGPPPSAPEPLVF